jgi:hypothetical protein
MHLITGTFKNLSPVSPAAYADEIGPELWISSFISRV